MSIKIFKWKKKNIRKKEVAIQEKKEQESIQEATSEANPPIFTGRGTSSTLLSTVEEHDEKDSEIESPGSYSSEASSAMPSMKSTVRKHKKLRRPQPVSPLQLPVQKVTKTKPAEVP